MLYVGLSEMHFHSPFGFEFFLQRLLQSVHNVDDIAGLCGGLSLTRIGF
jgi:hypothetical protein